MNDYKIKGLPPSELWALHQYFSAKASQYEYQASQILENEAIEVRVRIVAAYKERIAKIDKELGKYQ